ncbi:MAG: flagellar export chaperone FliS [Acidimicrobiales bacterium]
MSQPANPVPTQQAQNPQAPSQPARNQLAARNQIAARNQYVKSRTTTATPAQLIAMLYDAAIAAMRSAADAESSGRRSEASEQLVRAQTILTELRCSLNLEAGPLAEDLDRIYEFVWRQLVRANVTRDSLLVMRCVELIVPLRQAWGEACLGLGHSSAGRLSA